MARLSDRLLITPPCMVIISLPSTHAKSADPGVIKRCYEEKIREECGHTETRHAVTREILLAGGKAIKELWSVSSEFQLSPLVFLTTS
jgi:hypothetical protein